MNLWVKRIGQLVFVPVALFFLSCSDDAGVLGYRNPNKKFDIFYVEIPLESSVLLFDSIRTNNSNQLVNETVRLLSGSYTDPVFGDISARAVSEFFTLNVARQLRETAVYDSAVLEFNIDFSFYGSQSETIERWNVHEVTQLLDSTRIYQYNDVVAYDPNPIGSTSFRVNPAFFRDQLATQQRLDTTVRVKLNDVYGQRLFNVTKAGGEDYSLLYVFRRLFNGLMLAPDQTSSKILGFNPLANSTRLVLHFHDAEEDSLSQAFSFSVGGIRSFNLLSAQRQGELAALTTTHQPFDPASGLRYIQSATGVMTKIDFSKFHEFADTVENIIINSAELTITGVQTPGAFAPPPTLTLALLDNNNRIRRFATPTDVSNYIPFPTFMYPFDYTGNVFSMQKSGLRSESGQSHLALGYSESNQAYRGFITLFMQEYYRASQEHRDRFSQFVFYPIVNYQINPTNGISARSVAGKEMNRVVFPKDNLKLRIYYTKPTAQPNQ